MQQLLVFITQNVFQQIVYLPTAASGTLFLPFINSETQTITWKLIGTNLNIFSNHRNRSESSDHYKISTLEEQPILSKLELL